MTSTAYIDIHALHTVPYANLNRDDLGSPKTLLYGGSERLRVSSQAWKRAVRHEAERALGDPAVRTRRIAQGVASRLVAQGWDAALAEAAGRQVITSAGLRADEEGAATSAALYLPAAGLDELAAIAAAHERGIATEAGKKKPAAVLPRDQVLAVLRSKNGTIQLMGRMLAELPGGEVDGAVQFAHAFTTHAATPETDFFTAVDDIASAGPGSAHMGMAQFAAGTFYRYANVGVAGLLSNLNGDAGAARAMAAAFLRAFITAMPSGKQNATAAQTVPDLVYIAVRADRPISLAPAFEDPVRSQLGYSQPSADALSDYASRLHDYWGASGRPWHGHACTSGKQASGLGERSASLDALLGEAIDAAFPGAGQP